MRSIKSVLGIGFGIIVFAVLAIYIHRQSAQFLAGPTIALSSLPEQPVPDAFFTLQGTATNVAFLSLNGAQMYTDEKGVFSEKLLLLKGYNILELRARDRFGRERVVSVEIVHTPPHATTTASSSEATSIN